jgi:Ca2+-binding EF-hand superfamily protein
MVISMLTLAAFAGTTLLTPTTSVAADKKADKKKKKKANKAADKLEVLFKNLDTNNDGKLSRDEFAKIAAEKKKNNNAAAVELVAKKVAKAAKKGEKKKNKKTSKTDQLFTKLDTNKDGFLSRDEFRKLTEIKAELKKNKKAK